MNKTLDGIITKYREKQGNVIFLLQETQDALGYIPQDAIEYFSEELEIAPSKFYGVVTFYSQFHLKPRGKNIVSVCLGTACHVKGGSKIAERVLKDLGLSADGETTEDGKFTFEVVRCVGACSIAPVVLVNSRAYAEMTADGTSKLVKQMKKEESGAAH
ncbi:MAG TPA: NAD(P)H-dependent oxidoreductase subunit E [Thermodesulfovibrionales bacterium]|nr:NAD(P)H-dependent oxidoreductase subunit E [Thermodesulfovibrionales bacterium]